MMGALGNGRRGGRSPSLLMAALIACILLLGFNYWVSNSRNIELQSKILELEDRMRLLAADRDREQQNKLKVEDEMRIQKEKMEINEDTHRIQQDNALNNWNQEKETLKLNISLSAKTVQEMKNRMKSILDDLGKMQYELMSCRSNADTFTTQCDKQIATLKEKCSEKTAEAKLEKQKAEKEPASVAPKKLAAKAKSEVPVTNHSDKDVAELSKAAVIIKNSSTPTTKPTFKNETLDKSTREKVTDAVVAIKRESPKTDTLLEEAGLLEPKDDDIRIRLGDVDKEKARIGEGKEDAIMYESEGEIEIQLSKIKDENQGDLEEDVANYNGDDENQPEPEDEKQAELTGL